jgi:hypothetical protein
MLEGGVCAHILSSSRGCRGYLTIITSHKCARTHIPYTSGWRIQSNRNDNEEEEEEKEMIKMRIVIFNVK